MALLDNRLANRLHIHPVIFYSVLAVLAAVRPVCLHYEESVYNRDVAEFKEQKRIHYDAENARLKLLRVTLYREWVATHDTTLREVAGVERIPTYGEKGYYRKTGRMVCKERKGLNDMICEPEKEFVVTGHYLSGYILDTTWTDGYASRDEWDDEAWTYARKEAERRRVKLAYTGHPNNFIQDSGPMAILIPLSIMSMFYLGYQVLRVLLILLMYPAEWVCKKLFNEDKW